MTSTRTSAATTSVIVAVLKGALRIEECGHLSSEEEVRDAGGVDADDRIEVAPFLPKEGRLSFVTSDPRAVDLEAFRHLARGGTQLMAKEKTMSKKKTEKKPTAKKVPESKAKTSTERPKAKKIAKGKELPPTAATVPTKDASTAPAVPPTPDPRLPATGTLLQKRDRHGAVRCECTVEEGGVRYAGKVYRSLSSAAMAAAKDLGLTNKTQNGFVFWGLSKPPRRPGDPMVVIERAWERYHRNVDALVKEGVTDENRSKVAAAVRKHAQVIESLCEQVA